jgi:hypothetical protein
MTSVKQIGANRRNASQSSGPRTEKARTAPAAMQCVRHGLSAEIRIAALEGCMYAQLSSLA